MFGRLQDNPFPMRLLLLAALGLSVGCASISNVQMADTLGKGNFQVGIEPGVWGAASGQGTAFIPHVDGAVRFGVSEGVDLGVRAGFSLVEFQSKFLFTKPGDRHLAISLAPTIGGFVGGGGTSTAAWLNIGVPLLIGIKLPGGSEFVIGPRLQNLVVWGSSTGSGGGSAIYGLAVGSSLGFAWRISDSFGIMPEVSAVYPVVGAANFAGLTQASSGFNAGLAIVQVKLGFLVGRFRPLNDDLQQGPPPPGRVPVANPPMQPSPPPPGQPAQPGDLTPPPMPPPAI